MQTTIKKFIALRNDILEVVRYTPNYTFTVTPLIAVFNEKTIVITQDILVNSDSIIIPFAKMDNLEKYYELSRREFESRKREIIAAQIELSEEREKELQKQIEQIQTLKNNNQ